MTQRSYSVPGWAQATVLAGAVVSIALLGLMLNVTDKTAGPDSVVPPVAVTGVVVMVVGTFLWTMWTPSVSGWARAAVVVTASQLAISLACWMSWQTIAPRLEASRVSFPLLEDLPAPWVALWLGGAVLVASSFARRRRTGAPRWLNAVVVFALAYLLLLACWLPLVATQVPDSNTYVVDVRPWIDDYVVMVLLPPAMMALAAALVVERRPAWLVRFSREMTLATAVFVAVALVGAISARADAPPGAQFMYGNFVHVLFSVAVFALLSLTALAWSHARAMAAGHADLARPAPWVQEGIVIVEPGAEPVVGQVVYHGVLGGLRTTVGGFVLRTEQGDLPVPAGARLNAALPLSTTAARPGGHATVLTANQKVVVTGFVVPGENGPFRGSTLPVPGPDGLVVTVPRLAHETTSRDVLLLVWRPCAVFLVVAALAALPGIFTSHAPYEPPDDLDEIVKSQRL